MADFCEGESVLPCSIKRRNFLTDVGETFRRRHQWFVKMLLAVTFFISHTVKGLSYPRQFPK
jgi:hypothetical protein